MTVDKDIKIVFKKYFLLKKYFGFSSVFILGDVKNKKSSRNILSSMLKF